MTIRNSTFDSNRASSAAGAIENYGGTMSVSNSTFAGNRANDGGGISNGGTMTFINSTLAGNHASAVSGGRAGGIFNWGTVTLQNTIVANNTGGNNCFVFDGAIVDGGGNLSFPDTICPGINGDPKLGPLQNNGGLTATMALGAGSGALDAADDTICEAAPVKGLDQRGVIRPKGAHCDIGAVEQEPYPVPDAYKIWLAAVHAHNRGGLGLRWPDASTLSSAVPRAGSLTITSTNSPSAIPITP